MPASTLVLGVLIISGLAAAAAWAAAFRSGIVGRPPGPGEGSAGREEPGAARRGYPPLARAAALVAVGAFILGCAGALTLYSPRPGSGAPAEAPGADSGPPVELPGADGDVPAEAPGGDGGKARQGSGAGLSDSPREGAAESGAGTTSTGSLSLSAGEWPSAGAAGGEELEITFQPPLPESLAEVMAGEGSGPGPAQPLPEVVLATGEVALEWRGAPAGAGHLVLVNRSAHSVALTGWSLYAPEADRWLHLTEDLVLSPGATFTVSGEFSAAGREIILYDADGRVACRWTAAGG